MQHSALHARRGFTLIELLLVIGIIAILASIVIVAINPTKQLGDARDAQRRSDVNTVLNAVYQYAIDNNGNLPPGIPVSPASAKEVCRAGADTGAGANGDATDCVTTGAGAGVLLDVLTGSYLVRIPVDPQLDSSTGTGTNYFIMQDTDGRITVTAPGAEQSETGISVTR